MAQEEEGGEVSGSRSSRARRRWQRRRTPEVCPAPPTRTTRSMVTESGPPPPPPAPSTRITRSRITKSEPPPPPKTSSSSKEQSKKRKRAEPPPPPKTSSPSKEQSKKRKRATKRNTLEEEEEEEEDEKEEEEEAAAAAAAAAAASSASHAAEEASSEVSSPLCYPYLHRTVVGVDPNGREILEPYINIDPSITSAHRDLKDRYYAKLDRQMKLPSLDQKVPSSCLVDPDLLAVRASATTTVLQISKVVLGLSSYLDGLQLAHTSGFLIDWNARSKIGTVLTSAILIQSKSPSVDEWLARDEYAPNAKVSVHLLDKNDTVVGAELVFFDKHFNIALFKATIDLSAQIPPFSTDVKYAQEVLILGRDESQNLRIDHGSVEYKDLCVYMRHHYMFVDCGIEKPAIGGPVISFDGEILGMASASQTAFIPSSIILTCLDMWKKFDCIPRLHVGMKFSPIIFLDPAHIEKISRKCGIDAGLIVQEVSWGSVAEKLGIRAGDIIKYWNREKISTTVELENFLFRLCEKHLDQGTTVGSNVDISIDIFHMRKDSNDTIKLTVNVSKDVEIVKIGSYAVTSRDCRSGHDDDEVPGTESQISDRPPCSNSAIDPTPPFL